MRSFSAARNVAFFIFVKQNHQRMKEDEMYKLAQELSREPRPWIHNAAERMRVYEFIVEADQYGTCYQDPIKSAAIQEAMLALVRVAMTAAPDLVGQELLLAMTFLADPWMEEEVGVRVEALCARAGIAHTCTDDSVGLQNIFRSSSDHQPMAPCGENALRNQVQPNLHLLSHSQDAWKQVAYVFLYNWEGEVIERPIQVVRECAMAMYAINPDLFHSVYRDVVGERADGSEAYEAAEWFWTACGFPGTCFKH
jgi:hypothetical protein